MLETPDFHSKARRAGWALTAAALLPLALVGCQPRQPVSPQANAPQERVAGERQEQIDSETLQVVQQAGLPETFAFGGRTWRAHQVHWVSQDEVGTAGQTGTRTPGMGATGTGTTGTGTTGTGTTGTGTTGAGTADDQAAATGDATFQPVAQLQVNGHQIFRQRGADEAVTDNIFLRAENATPPAGGTEGAGTGQPSTGGEGATTQTPGTTGEGATEGTEPRVAFVEYDAGENLVENMELPNVLQATGLPETVQYGGKTWRAQEIQVYDADVFDEIKATPQPVGGQTAFMGEDQDTLLLQGELDPSQMTGATGTETPGTTEESPATEGAPGATGSQGEAMQAGPVFIRYQAE